MDKEKISIAITFFVLGMVIVNTWTVIDYRLGYEQGKNDVFYLYTLDEFQFHQELNKKVQEWTKNQSKQINLTSEVNYYGK